MTLSLLNKIIFFLAANAFFLFSSNVNAESFDNLEKAFFTPEKVTILSVKENNPEIKRLSPQIGKLTNLKELTIMCMEALEDLPPEIGNLKKLEKLIIDNGNGCVMNVTIPASIGELKNLKILRLYGAIDPRDGNRPAPASKIKKLPNTMANLANLEELDLGRNGIKYVPPEVVSLKKLKKLSLDFNEIHEIPSFVGNLENLKLLSIRSNGGVNLPESLKNLNGLKVIMGNNALTLKNQEKLKNRFPNIIFDFTNEYDDDAANEEAVK